MEEKTKTSPSENATNDKHFRVWKFLKRHSIFLLLFCIPIVDTIIFSLILIKNYSNDELFITLLKISSCIFSSCVSVSSTVVCYNLVESEHLTKAKILAIIFGLLLHTIVEIMFLYMQMNYITTIIFSFIFVIASIILSILIYVYIYKPAEKANQDIIKNANDFDVKTIENLKNEKIGEKNYKLEGEDKE